MRVLFIVLSIIAITEARRGSPSRFGTVSTPYSFYNPSATVGEVPKINEVKAVKNIKAPCECPHTRKLLGRTIDCDKCMKKVEEALEGLE